MAKLQKDINKIIFAMQTRTAYLNGFTKRQEIDLNMGSLKNNLKNMQAMNKSSIQLDQVNINKNKTKYLVGKRTEQIDRQNSILARKIKEIIYSRDKNKYHSQNDKYSKSLNGLVKKDAQRRIDVENSKLVDRLQVKKPTYPTKKLMREWVETQYLEKKASKFDFHIGESPIFNNKSKIRRNSSINASINDCSFKTEMFLGGKKWDIKVYEMVDEVKIIGEHCLPYQNTQKDRQVKLITIPIEQVKILLRKHCQGKIKNITKLLAVDGADESLVLITPPAQVLEPVSSVNPEERHHRNAKKVSPAQSSRNSQPPKHLLLQDIGKLNTSNVVSSERVQKLLPVSSRDKKKLEPIKPVSNKIDEDKEKSIGSLSEVSKANQQDVQIKKSQVTDSKQENVQQNKQPNEQSLQQERQQVKDNENEADIGQKEIDSKDQVSEVKGISVQQTVTEVKNAVKQEQVGQRQPEGAHEPKLEQPKQKSEQQTAKIIEVQQGSRIQQKNQEGQKDLEQDKVQEQAYEQEEIEQQVQEDQIVQQKK